jgi:hypothetical protein
MIPRSGELFVILLAVVAVLAFYRLPAVGDALGRWFVGKRQLPPGPTEKR